MSGCSRRNIWTDLVTRVVVISNDFFSFFLHAVFISVVIFAYFPLKLYIHITVKTTPWRVNSLTCMISFSSCYLFLQCSSISCIVLFNSNNDFPFSHSFPKSTRLSSSLNLTRDSFITLSVLFKSGINNVHYYPRERRGQRARFVPVFHRVRSRLSTWTRTLVLVAGFPGKSPTAALTTG